MEELVTNVLIPCIYTLPQLAKEPPHATLLVGFDSDRLAVQVALHDRNRKPKQNPEAKPWLQVMWVLGTKPLICKQSLYHFDSMDGTSLKHSKRIEALNG